MTEKYFKIKTDKDKLIYVIDAKDFKTGLLLNLGSIFLGGIIFALFYFIGFYQKDFDWSFDGFNYIPLIFCAAIIIYLILHELVHGIVYKIVTKEKLTFGISLTCAYCGVKDIYVQKKYALIAVLAPFLCFSIIIGTFFIVSYLHFNVWISFYTAILFSIHFGGCIGDIFVTIKLLTLKGDIYTLDTGPRQEFYVREK